MVMPGRITTLSGGHASPGPQAIPLQDRPVPAVRRLSQGPGQNAAPDIASSEFSRSQGIGNRNFQNSSPRTPPSQSRGFDGSRHQEQQYGASSPVSPYNRPQGYQEQRQMRSVGGYTNSSRPVSAVRPQSAMAVTSPSFQTGPSPVVERPPSSLGVAWGSAYKSLTPALKQNSADSAESRASSNDRNSLEFRLKSLVTDDSDAGRGSSRVDGSNRRGQQRHQDSTTQISLHQRSRSYGDGATLGETYGDGYGDVNDFIHEDVYAQVSRRQDPRRSYESIPGYVPQPRPNEPQQISTRTTNAQGNDNKAFESDDKHAGAKESQGASGYDLRSAWQRLYGNRPGGGAQPSQGRRQSIEDSLDSSIAGDTSNFIRSSSQRYTQNTQQPSYQGNHGLQQHGLSETVSNIINPEASGIHHSPSSYSASNLRDPQQTWGSVAHAESSDYSNPYLLLPSPTEPSSGGRESPTGQSSSNPDQVSGSNNSSQLSAISTTSNKLTTFKPEKKKKQISSAVDSNLHKDLSTSLGPAAKYPDSKQQQRGKFSGSQYISMNSISRSPGLQRHQQNSPRHTHRNRPSSSSSHGDLSNPRRHRSDSHSSEGTAEFVVRGEGKGCGLNRPASRGKDPSALFIDSDEEDHLGGDYQLGPLDSVFDYPVNDEDQGRVVGAGSDHDGSVSPPLPPLSTMQETSSRSPSRPYVREDTSRHKHTASPSPAEFSQPDRIDLLKQDYVGNMVRQGMPGPVGYSAGVDARREKSARHMHVKDTRHHKPSLTDYARSRSLEDVRESGNESVISFDVENTMLMVEPSDQSEMGTLRSQAGGSSVRAQLNRLEGMYSQVMKSLEDRRAASPAGGAGGDGGVRSRARRRWSIGSCSDTSSMRRHHHHHHHHQHGHREHHGSGGSRHSRGAAAGDSDGSRIDGKNGRAIGKRFQRLESHVITLARSVAHLSSELRSHNSMSREMENVKREIQELKKSRDGSDRYHMQAPGHFMGDNNRLLTEFERCKGWVPSLTNPRRVNKLTKFFGQEPPLLEIFMRRLGYEKYVKNFEDEHIGMIELPYMTEERLKSIGIPMGPRLRILQEAQMCFQQGNFDVYFV